MDERIDRARGRLAELRAAPAAPGPDTPAMAASEDERIRVSAAGRRLTAVELDPRLLRLDADDLAADLTAVINTALARARPLTPDPQDVPPIDLDAIRTGLDSALAEGQDGMRRLTGALGDAVAQINERAVMRGTFEPPDFEGLLARTRAALAAAGGGARGETEGEAWAVNDRLYAKAASSGRVVRLVWEYGLGSPDIRRGVQAEHSEQMGIRLARDLNPVEQWVTGNRDATQGRVLSGRVGRSGRTAIRRIACLPRLAPGERCGELGALVPGSPVHA